MGSGVEAPGTDRVQTASGRPRYRDIDGLRAVAVALVVAFHVVPAQVSGGFIGVDVFFVISGFLITGLIVGERAGGRFSFASFYGRRIRRLFPALIVVLAASLVAGWFLLPPADLEKLGRSAVAAAFFVPNLVLWRSWGYFDAAAPVNPLVHLWSLGVEEQFYLVWPLVIAVLWRRPRALVPGLWVLTGASFLLCLWLTAGDPRAAFYLPVSRLWELGVGGLLAVHLPLGGERREQMAPQLATSLAAAGLVLLAVSAFVIGPTTPFPGAAALGPTLAAVLVLAAGERSWLNRRVLSTQVLVGIGLISYPLYLWHWPLLATYQLVEDQRGALKVRLALVALAVVLSWLTYRFLERPFRLRFASPAATIGLVAAMLAVALGGFAVWRSDGAPGRYGEEIREIARWQHGHDPYGGIPGCFRDGPDVAGAMAPCYPAPADGRGSVIVWGDSQAAALAAGVRSVLAPDDRVWQFTPGACPPVLGYGDAACRESNDRVMTEVEAEPPDLLVVFAAWPAYPDPARGEAFADPAFPEHLAQTLADAREVTDGRMVLIGPAPVWNPDLPTNVVGEYWRNGRRIAGRLPGGWSPALRATDAELASMAQELGIYYVSMLDLLCNDAGCLTHLPGRPTTLYAHDSGHLTTEGALDVARRLQDAGALP